MTASRCRRLWDGVTIEPVVACYMTAYTLISLTVLNLNLQKACKVNLGRPDDECDALMAGRGDIGTEETIQQLVTNMQLWQTCAQNAAPCLLVLLAGSWSDRTRRRVPCMLLPLIGELLRNAGQLVCVFYFRQLPMEAAGLAETIPIALTGGQTMMTMTTYSYVGDTTTAKLRTFKIGSVNAVMAISMAVGTSMSGIVYNKLGFYGAYGVSSILLVVGLLYGLFFVDDIAPVKGLDEKKSFRKSVLEFFDLRHVTQSFSTTFKKRQGNQRLKIIILLITLMGSAGTNYGFRTVSYLYTRLRFNWNEVEFSFYSTYELLINITGLLFAVFVLSRKLKLSDEIIGVLSTTSQSLAALFYFFANTAPLFYAGPLINILVSSENMSIKSLMTKLVPSTEIGQLAAVFSIAEIIFSLIFGLMYNGLYEITLKTLPGAFYIITFVFIFPSIALFLWMYVKPNHDGDPSYGPLISEDVPSAKTKSVDYGTVEKS